jgi:Tfp pilus assembly protein PilV
MNRTRRSSFRTRALAAFSLIEVLISVLVLALGLLGLGAMFPVIIRQQRQATDATLGTMAANAARLELENNGIFRGTPSLPAAAGGPIGDPTPPDAWSSSTRTCTPRRSRSVVIWSRRSTSPRPA